MIQNQKGFTLVELIVTMTIFVLVIAAASGVFTGLLTQFKQQSKITETNIEGVVGLEILRHDLSSAGLEYHGTVLLHGIPLQIIPKLPQTPAGLMMRRIMLREE